MMSQSLDAKQVLDRGWDLYCRRQYEQALAEYSLVERDSPLYSASLHLRALAHRELGHIEMALELLRDALRLKPDNARGWGDLGKLCFQAGHHQPAIACFEMRLKLAAGDWESLRYLGLSCHALGKEEEALGFFLQMMKTRPEEAEAYRGAAAVLSSLGRCREALEHSDRALQLSSASAETWTNRAAIYFAMKDFLRARECAEQAVKIAPHFVEAWTSGAKALAELADYGQARQCLMRALEIEPGNKTLHFELGIVAFKQIHYEEALACFERALALDAGYLDARSNRAACLLKLERTEEAIAALEAILHSLPNHAESLNNLGFIYLAQKKFAAAVERFERAIAVKPDYVDALVNLAGAMDETRQWDKALTYYSRAYEAAPEHPELLGSLLNAKLRNCDWADWEALKTELLECMRAGKNICTPFRALPIVEDAALLKNSVASYCAKTYGEKSGSLAIAPPGQKIRVGYYSSDFREHPVAYSMAEIFEHHDRDRFEILGFSYDLPEKDEMYRRIAGSIDRMYDLDGLSNSDAVRMGRELQLDVAVDLAGFTGRARARIFIERVAPVQMNYMGYPGTAGVANWDYILADEVVVPASHRSYYGEKVIWLPGCFQANSADLKVEDRVYSRAELGLPNHGFVFCCFNGLHKLQPSVFKHWMSILRQVPGSVLWLVNSNATAKRNLRASAEGFGVAGERVVFTEPVSLAEHHARQMAGDLFLDTTPFNAGATASSSLRVGLPILTCAGETFSARMGASLLSALGMQELITYNLEEYVERAVKIAATEGMIDEIKRRMKRRVAGGGVFESRRITRHLEAAYQAATERARQGLPPDHLNVRGWIESSSARRTMPIGATPCYLLE